MLSHVSRLSPTTKRKTSWRVSAFSGLVDSDALPIGREESHPTRSQIKQQSSVSPQAGFIVCTVATKNHLSHVRVLTESFLRHHPYSKVFVLLVDEVADFFEPDAEKFHLVHMEELDIEKANAFRFKYSVAQTCTAAKPFFLEYLFKTYGLRRIVYLDCDIMVTGSIDDVANLLDNHCIILTPHLLHPIEDDRRPNELDILLAGTYNTGFMAISNTETAASFLRWWQARVYDYCKMEPLKGLCGDQKWIDLALGFFDGIYILRDPGYNVAYWNMGTRRLAVVDGKYFANERPLRFFHFSGFDPDNLNHISRYQNRFTLGDRPEYRSLFETYRDLLCSNGYETVKQWPWAYDYFENGVRIPELARSIYQESTQLQRKYLNPFMTRERETYFEWLNSSAELMPARPYITRLWNEVYKLREDVQETYPDVFGLDRGGFVRWVIDKGCKEHGIEKAFVPEEYFTASKFVKQPRKSFGLNISRMYRSALHELAVTMSRSVQVIRHEGCGSFLRQARTKIGKRELRIVRPARHIDKQHFARLSDIQLD